MAVGAALGSPVANEGSTSALWPAALVPEGWSGLYPVPQQSLGHSVQTDVCLLRGTVSSSHWSCLNSVVLLQSASPTPPADPLLLPFLPTALTLSFLLKLQERKMEWFSCSSEGKKLLPSSFCGKALCSSLKEQQETLSSKLSEPN